MNAAPTSARFATPRERRLFWITLAAGFVLDQTAKTIAQLTLAPEGWQLGDAPPKYLFSVDGLVHGTWMIAPLKPLQEMSGGLAVITAIMALLFWGAVFWLIALKPGKRHFLTMLGGALLFAGIASNALDHAAFGGVRNFMELGFDNPLWRQGSPSSEGIYAQRPIFSTAAVMNWVGLPLLVFGAITEALRQRRTKTPVPPPPRPRKPSAPTG